MKYTNCTDQQIFAKGLSLQNNKSYTNAKSHIFQLLQPKADPNRVPSKQLIRACLKPKILSFHDLGEFSDNKKYRHKLNISWTREPIENDDELDQNQSDDENMQTEAEHPAETIAEFEQKTVSKRKKDNPIAFFDQHQATMEGTGPFNNNIQNIFMQIVDQISQKMKENRNNGNTPSKTRQFWGYKKFMKD